MVCQMCISYVHMVAQVNTLDLSPAGTLLATGTKEGTLTVWDLASPLPLNQLTCHSGKIHQVAFSPGECVCDVMCVYVEQLMEMRVRLMCFCVQTAGIS